MIFHVKLIKTCWVADLQRAAGHRGLQMPEEPTMTPEPPSKEPKGPMEHPRIIDSKDLFDGDRELCIDHKGALYRLKITRQDKLILNK